MLTQDSLKTIESKLSQLENDMIRLEEENARLRKNTEGAYFERDACIGLLARMSVKLGMNTGRAERETELGTERRVIIDLPAGQVSWDYLESESHLFESLPSYENAVEDQSVQDTYMRVMNPGL